MPFPLIPTALGLCFLLVWAFIAGMVLRDGQQAAQRDREAEGNILPLGRPTPWRTAGSDGWARRRTREARPQPAARKAS